MRVDIRFDQAYIGLARRFMWQLYAVLAAIFAKIGVKHQLRLGDGIRVSCIPALAWGIVLVTGTAKAIKDVQPALYQFNGKTA